ncbi:MAG TPA: vanadium-dependent haloperoxidase [Polyangiaceae bacterium]|nr:vanadium-dependent haloperoxidase [Polyangiaceae bacterium]
MRRIPLSTIGTLALGLLAWTTSLDARAQASPTRSFSQTWGPQYQSQVTAAQVLSRTDQAIATERRSSSSGVTTLTAPTSETLTRVRVWNLIAQTAVAVDHTPPTSGETRVFGEQLGPARSARALAIAHIALFEAANAATGGAYRSYLGLAPDTSASVDAAIAQGTHDALVALYPSLRSYGDRALAIDLSLIPNGTAKTRGIDLGRRAAAAILARRANDGSQHLEPRLGIEYFPPVGPGLWSQDPISQVPIALGAFWFRVAPFVMQSASQFRAPAPPALNSSAYTAAFNEVARLGGCGSNVADCSGGFATPTQRTSDQTIAGIFWGYDGTPGLGTPPRLYNQITVQIAMGRGTNALQLARLLALTNVAMSDAALACWETKYVYDHWRPITGIRRANEDGNSSTAQNATFSPLGAPATNTTGPNFTPPFPAYTSGHSTIGSSVFQTLRLFYGTDAIPFTFVSDEFNGNNRDNRGNVRPRLPRSFSSLTQAEDENGQSRIYLGIHWAHDKNFGRTQGRNVAQFIMSNVFLPR